MTHNVYDNNVTMHTAALYWPDGRLGSHVRIILAMFILPSTTYGEKEIF